MSGRVTRSVSLGVVLACVCAFLLPGAAPALESEIAKALENSKYVYISSQRKDGSWSRPAEIWFLYHNGAVYVGTSPQSWRAKRIRWGRPRAKIAVGKPEGPTFFARGAIVNEPATVEKMVEVYAKKYSDRWAKHEESFRNGFRDGRRVLIRYTPE
ncbi:MAG: hypothetical protein KatS3mg077_2518 [Candidatus Binatia bacterium]|nr:MAG: hypothetical protein KatS3mg077_2518 [Candidatus Binatia bacterium]